MQQPLTFDFLRSQIVGIDSAFETPFGKRLMVYCDYTASGRCLLFVERYLQRLQRIYANTHTEDDLTGRSMSRLLHEAERTIKRAVNAGPHGRIVACGTGATGAIDKLQQILGVALATRHAQGGGGPAARLPGRGEVRRVSPLPAVAAAGRLRRALRAPQQRSHLAAGTRHGRRSEPRGRRQRGRRAPASTCCSCRSTRADCASVRSRRRPTSPACAPRRARSRGCCMPTMRTRVSITPRARPTSRST